MKTAHIDGTGDYQVLTLGDLRSLVKKTEELPSDTELYLMIDIFDNISMQEFKATRVTYSYDEFGDEEDRYLFLTFEPE